MTIHDLLRTFFSVRDRPESRVFLIHTVSQKLLNTGLQQGTIVVWVRVWMPNRN